MKIIKEGSIWSYKDYLRLWVSGLLANVGATAFPIALAVTILDTGGDATSLGLILAARVLSGVLLAPVGGVWADRLPRKYVMIGADVFRAFLALILVFVAAPSIPLFVIAILVFIMGAGDAFGAPAAAAIMPTILPTEKLPAGNVARGIVVKLASIVGPGIGGLSVIAIGGRLTFAVTTIFFAVGAYLLFPIVEPKYVKNVDAPKFLVDLKEGLKTVWSMPWVAAVIAMASIQLMVVLGAEQVLLPIISRREFGTDTVFAASAALFSIGAVISALLAMRYQAKHPGLVSISVWGILVVATLVLAFPISPTFVMVGYLIAGLSVGPWDAYWVTAIQREIPQELQGRVFSIDHMGSVGLLPLGMALVGPAVNLVGEKELLIGASIFHVVVCIAVLFVPGVIDLKMPKKANYSQGEHPKA
ncbi:MAG: MFS transporter [Candidatus Planktophila sp.]|nr:MFS transporter [Candidatus Planktophila sp.]